MTLFLAIRPFQVNPPWQFLNLPGGVARVDTISLQASSAHVTGNKFVRSLASPSGFGAVTFDEGNIVDWLRAGNVPARNGHRSNRPRVGGVLVSARARSARDFSPIDIAVPLHGGDINLALLPGQGERAVAAQLERVARRSGGRSSAGLQFTLPAFGIAIHRDDAHASSPTS